MAHLSVPRGREAASYQRIAGWRREIRVTRLLHPVVCADRTFQILLTLSETTGRTEAMSRAYATTATTEHGTSIDLIEAEGWKLEHAGYVYRQTGSVSRDKFFSSGHQEAVHGEIVGVYIFRISENEDTTGDAGRPER